MSLVPGLGIVRGMSLTLRKFFEPKVTIKYPEVRLDPPHKFRGRLQLLYDEYDAFMYGGRDDLPRIVQNGVETVNGRVPELAR